MEDGLERLYEVMTAQCSPTGLVDRYAMFSGEHIRRGLERARSTPKNRLTLMKDFAGGEIDVLLFSRVGSEGLNLVVNGDLRACDVNDRGAWAPPNAYPKRLDYCAYDPTECALLEPYTRSGGAWVRAENGRRWVRLRMPSVRTYCSIGLPWTRAAMDQSTSRFIRAKSHPMGFDGADLRSADLSRFQRGSIHVHRIVTVRPDKSTAGVKTSDERKEELMRQKDAQNHDSADKLSGHLPGCVNKGPCPRF